jgi:hypothetical protein
VLILSGYQVYSKPTECGDPTSKLSYFTLIFSGSYFTYDFLCMAYFGLLEIDMFIHHLLCILGILQVLLYNNGANYVVLGLFIAEVSNPPMHCRILLRNIGKRYSRAYELAEYMYFMLFFFGRIIIGHPAVYATVTCYSAPLFARVVSVGILLQSYQFLYRMYFIFNSRIKETAERRSKGIKIHWFEPIPLETLKECDFWKKS